MPLPEEPILLSGGLSGPGVNCLQLVASSLIAARSAQKFRRLPAFFFSGKGDIQLKIWLERLALSALLPAPWWD